MPKKITDDDIRAFAALYNEHGTMRAAGARSDPPIPQGKATHKRYRRALAMGLIERPGHSGTRTKEELKEGPAAGGHVRPLPTRDFTPPAEGQVRRYICTSAQNNTKMWPHWRNLLALAKHYDAAVLVSRFTYDKRTHRAMDKGEYAVGGGHSSEVHWPEEVLPYLCDDRVTLAPGLVFCGEMNILPTAVRPLSGMEAYTGRKSSIFPHVKLAMESVPSGKHEATKFIYTTGTVTQRNYIQRKAGLKADFHHCYGALLVEVDSDGDWFVRQLNADKHGVIYDLNLCASDGHVTTVEGGYCVEGINWGDIHRRRVDPTVRRLNWDAPDSIINVLRPRYQFFHDLLDFYARGHHDRSNPHKMFRRYVEGTDSVEDEVREAVLFLEKLSKMEHSGKLVVVDSNHDNALTRWLREADFREDPLNAIFYLKAQLAVYRAIESQHKSFHLLQWAALCYCKNALLTAKFLMEDESFVICPDAGGGIECGMHGHLGPNGARGGANAFARMGRKSNVGHSHSAGIRDGVYTAGTSSLLDLEYNRGPSSWSHSHVVTYKNGKRAIITLWNGKWRA